MADYTLTRQTFADNGILGEITDENANHICYTCELPWLNNIPKLSCIPTGIYNVIPHDSAAHSNTWEISNVPGRTAILIHNGNTEKDVEGCVAVGSETGTLDGLPAVLNSDMMLKHLQQIWPQQFTLSVQNFNPFLV